jgi:predicted nucleotidyltransferase
MEGKLDRVHVVFPIDEITAFCKRHNIVEFALFGSVLRDDFSPESDVDVLITFAPDAGRSPDREDLRAELERIFDRHVDLTCRRVIENDPNYIIRRAILNSAQVIYAA